MPVIKPIHNKYYHQYNETFPTFSKSCEFKIFFHSYTFNLSNNISYFIQALNRYMYLVIHFNTFSSKISLIYSFFCRADLPPYAATTAIAESPQPAPAMDAPIKNAQASSAVFAKPNPSSCYLFRLFS